MRPLAIDLFCGAGGVSMGLHRAGFDVIGVDIKRQKNYPFTFVQGDATNPPVDLAKADFVWASPPCQAHTRLRSMPNAKRHLDHIAGVRSLLASLDTPWCIENVPGAPMSPTLVLTGDMFGAATYRKRLFETNFLVMARQPGRPFGPKSRPGSVTVTGSSGGSSKRDGWTNGTRDAWQAAMGIDWMTNKEMSQAIPPAYAEFIGQAALRSLSLAVAA